MLRLFFKSLINCGEIYGGSFAFLHDTLEYNMERVCLLLIYPSFNPFCVCVSVL
jgi:hypothetical protein